MVKPCLRRSTFVASRLNGWGIFWHSCWCPRTVQLQQWSLVKIIFAFWAKFVTDLGDVKTPKRLSLCHFGISVKIYLIFKAYYVGEAWQYAPHPSMNSHRSVLLDFQLHWIWNSYPPCDWLSPVICLKHTWGIWVKSDIGPSSSGKWSQNSISRPWYCWWRKSQTTTWDV